MKQGRPLITVLITIILVTVLIKLPADAKAYIKKSFPISHLIKHREKVKAKAKVAVLNHYMPSFDNLNDFIRNRNDRKADLNEYIDFYEKIAEYFPDIADVHGMLGFCYYYMGEGQKAFFSYKKAIEKNPSYFWFYHNLGIIYYKRGEYEKAIEMSRNALKLKPSPTARAVRLSKTYLPISSTVQNINETVFENLKSGYYNTYKIILLSHYRQKNYLLTLKNAQEAIEKKFEDTYFFYYYAGLAAYQLKKYNLALNYLGQYLESERNDPRAYYYFALTWQALGQSEEAQEAFRYAKIFEHQKGTTAQQEDTIHPEIF